MLPTLDRYLIVQFLRNMLLVLVALVAIFMVIDILFGFHLLVRPEPYRWFKVELFLSRLPGLINFALPVSAIISVLACTVPMLRRGEFTALGAAGFTVQRSTRVLLVGCLVVGLFDAVIADFATPRATARALAMQDRLEGQTREGRVWRTDGATWFAGSCYLVGEDKKPELDQVVVATTDRLAMAEQLIWQQEAWFAPKGLLCLFIEGGAQRMLRLPPGPLPQTLSLDLTPKDLQRRLLPRYTMTSSALLARSERADVALVWSRWTRFLIPVLAAMSAMAVFIRFRNRDRVVVAAIEACIVALIPIVLLMVSSMSSDTTPGPPWVGVMLGALIAAIPAGWLWWRWRL